MSISEKTTNRAANASGATSSQVSVHLHIQACACRHAHAEPCRRTSSSIRVCAHVCAGQRTMCLTCRACRTIAYNTAGTMKRRSERPIASAAPWLGCLHTGYRPRSQRPCRNLSSTSRLFLAVARLMNSSRAICFSWATCRCPNRRTHAAADIIWTFSSRENSCLHNFSSVRAAVCQALHTCGRDLDRM